MLAATAEAIAAAAAALDSLPNSNLSSNNTMRKKSTPGTTTACQNKSRNVKKAKGASQSKSDGHVKVTRKELLPILIDDTQKTVLKNYNDNDNFFGKVISATGNKGWKIEFDLFPADAKVVFVVHHKCIKLVGVGDEENPYDKATDIENYSSVLKKKKLPSPLQQSNKEFVVVPADDLKVISEFNMQYTEAGDAMTWHILKDREYLKPADDPCKYPREVQFLKDLDFVGNDAITQTFFDDFLSLLEGVAARMDEYYSDS